MSSEETGTEETLAPPTDDEGLLRFSLLYPGRDGWQTVLVGGILLLFSWLIIPLFIAAGYFVRLTHAAGRGNVEPPTFDEWWDLLVDGVKLVFVLLPAALVYALAVFLAAEIYEPLAFPVAIAGFYVYPSIYMNYAVTDDWKTAYNPSILIEQLTTTTYLYGFLLYVLVINGIGVIVATLLLGVSLLTIVGWIIIWPMIYFYWYGIDAALWGCVYSRLEAS
ncbi:Protein of unknown function [Halopenitus malekzadehii]|uniref:DUF4013 domain-containing protein n=1 Tax=Halopenitus malekzadehii TaxID=1267564 RepID=A0A1H6IY43_9EURY|nr:DUF4013 domain-containing protein [Halopenitus malekzadehii]SEH54115.1 Protein of unknown function [Halopenitus malekzadehii]